MSTPVPVLEARNLTKEYPGVKALDGVSLRVFPGEIHSLTGENGAGKSTLLKTIFGAQAPDSGEIYVDGELVELQGPAHAIGLGIAMVHQELSLVPQLDAIHNIVLGREDSRFGWINWNKARKVALPALQQLGFTASPTVPVRELSVAQQQLVEIARGVAAGARIMILDEPTASLTTHESEQLFKVIEGLRKNGTAIIYVSHRLREVMALSDRLTVLRDGKTVAEKLRGDIATEEEIVQLMVGRDVEAIGTEGSTHVGKEMLRVDSLHVPGHVKDVSLVAHQGEILGIAGMVGAGRTEFALGLIGAIKSSNSGTWINGSKVELKSPADAVRAKIAYLPEDRKSQGLALHMTTASNVTLPNPPGKFGLLDRKKQTSLAAQVMTVMASKSSVLVKAGSLSGGNQQKIVVGRWYLTDSDIYIFDEPTRGVDVGAKAEIHRLMRDLSESGKTVIMISSDLLEVLGMSDRILVMCRGEIAAELSREEATEEKIVAHAAG